MSRILIAECKQEISSFNPVICTDDSFTTNTGDALFTYHSGIETEISGALNVFQQRSDLTLIPAYGARSTSAGPLAQESFDRIASAFLDAIKQNASHIPSTVDGPRITGIHITPLLKEIKSKSHGLMN